MQGTAAMPPALPPRKPRNQTQLLLRKARSHRIMLDHVGLDPTFADMIVGFHAQQAIEKLIKAVLSDSHIAYLRGNDLDRLIRLLETEQITHVPLTAEQPHFVEDDRARVKAVSRIDTRYRSYWALCEPLLTSQCTEARQQNIVHATLVTGAAARTGAAEPDDRAVELVAKSLLSE